VRTVNALTDASFLRVNEIAPSAWRSSPYDRTSPVGWRKPRAAEHGGIDEGIRREQGLSTRLASRNGAGVDFRVLGPLEVADAGGTRINLGAPLQRAVLAVLLVHLNEVVSIDRLIDELWGETPPNAATASLQAYVSNLRRALEPDRPVRTPPTVLVTEAPGYVLHVPPEQLDAVRFEDLAVAGRRALESGDGPGALTLLDRALGMWRGDAFAEFAYGSFAAAAISRLHELRASAEEDRVEARLLVADDAGALAALGRLVTIYPLRERLRALQMRALYGAGRQAEALRAFDEARRLLAEELGVEPGRELQTLHRQVLTQDPALDHTAAPTRPHLPERADVRSQAPVTRRPSFVGRDDALGRLEAAVAEAAAGRTRIVLVEGEPGIGKTSLVTELAARVRGAGIGAWWGRCHDDEGAPALWPWVQILRGLEAGGEHLPERLHSVLATLVPELGATTEAELVPEAARFRLYDAIREAIEHCATRHPLMIVLDDVHWADLSSLRLLRFLAVELRDSPVVIVATLRNTEDIPKGDLGDTLADIIRQADVERLMLSGLVPEDIADMLRLTTSFSGGDLADVARSLHQRTNGNPFFIVELLRLMQSEGTLESGAVTIDVPVTISDVIRRRIGRLPDELQTVLGVAAVIGRQFDLDVLADACGLDADRTHEALDAALATRIVVETNPGRYEFTHALVSEALYLDLAPTRRARLHGRVAAAIEATWRADPEAHYHELAYHYSNGPGSVSGQAVKYANLAAEQASMRFAYDEAVIQRQAALDALERMPSATPAEQARALLELADAQRRAGNLATSSTVHDRALAIAKRSGDSALLAEAALAYGEVGLWQVRRYGTVDEHIVNSISDALARLDERDSALRARLLSGLAVALYYREGERERCLALVRDATAMARRIDDIGILATSLVELIVMLDGVPDQSEQLAAAAELRGLPAADLHPEAASATATRVARVMLASGDASTFERDIEHFAALAAATRHPDEQLWATWARATTAFLADRADDAERLAGEAFALHQQLGIWGAYETYALHMVLIWREQHRLADVEPLVEPFLAESVHPSASKLRGIFAMARGAIDEIPGLLDVDPVPRSRDFTWLADMSITAELAAAAELPCRGELYETLLPFEGRVVTMDATFICLGAVDHYLALLARSLGRDDEAAHHFERAIAINDDIGAIPWSRRTRAAVQRGTTSST
jgi:DNA-binding SARP family transcriptional activator